MVHINDIDWNVPGEEAIKKYNKGDAVKARVLDIDIEKERISLGIKQLSQDPTETIDLRKKLDRHHDGCGSHHRRHRSLDR